ncbi:MAG: hypothetical protein GY870_13780 [archaeon]|nr:hypothetical protein [archaeon]
MDHEEFEFHKFSKFALKNVNGIKHTLLSEVNTGLLIGKSSKCISNLNLCKISNVMSHFFLMGSSECENDLRISINEFNNYKIFSTRSKNRIISVVADNKIQVGLVRMLMQKHFQK